jgi:hypothetical protein
VGDGPTAGGLDYLDCLKMGNLENKLLSKRFVAQAPALMICYGIWLRPLRCPFRAEEQ